MQCKKCNAIIDDDSIFCKLCGKKQINEPRKELKKPNGFGTIIKLAGRRRRPYALRVTDTIKDGNQTYRYISYHETLKEAKKALAKEQITPTVPKANITLSELYEEWKATPNFTQISLKTQQNYTNAYSQLQPLHRSKFKDLRTGHYQNIIEELTNAKNIPLSKSSKSKVKILIGLLYKYAMENDICDKNYAQFIKLEKEDKKEKEIFNDLEIKKLFENDNLMGADIVLILIYTGLRINELLSLTKFSINLKNNTIIGGLKTDAGRDRTIPIHNKVLKYIKKRYDSATDEMLITKDNGTKLTYGYFREYIYYPLLEQLKKKRRQYIAPDTLVQQ